MSTPAAPHDDVPREHGVAPVGEESAAPDERVAPGAGEGSATRTGPAPFGQSAVPDDAADPEDRTVVHLMRHGEVHNPDGLLYGRLPGYHLSELGRQMAERVAEYLAPRDVTYVVSSPLERAQETAAPIAKAQSLVADTDERLIEAENIFQGKTFGVGDGALRRPANWKYLVNPFKPSWGEPYTGQAARMLAALGAARDMARGHEAVCVSHQLPIWIVRSFVERRRLWHDPRRRQCTLASLTTFTYQGDKLVSVAYSEPARALVPAHLLAGAKPVKGKDKAFGA
jgi:broad specificity phosphatase PhoE